MNLTLAPRLEYGRDLVAELVLRDLKVRYKRSWLGLAWSLLNPLLQLMVFYFIFQVVMRLEIPRYSGYALTGLLAWQWLHASLAQGTVALTANRELVRRPGFPLAVLPLVPPATNLVHFAVALPLLALFLTFSGGGPGLACVLLLPVLAVQFLLTAGLAYLLAALNATFRDTQHLLEVLLRLGMFMSPVFYSIDQVPERYHDLYTLNPVLHLLTAYRDVLLHARAPDWDTLALLALAGAALLALGVGIYRRVALDVAEEV